MRTLKGLLLNEKLHVGLLPFVFQGQIILNLFLAIFAPNMGDVFRKLIVYGFLSVVIVVCFFNINYDELKLQKAFIYSFVIWITIRTLFEIILGHFTLKSLFDGFIPNVFLCVLFMVGVLSIETSKRIKFFFQVLFRYVCLVGILSAVYVVYVKAFPNASPDIGNVSYMSIAYFLLTYLAMIILSFMFETRSRKEFSILFLCGCSICIAIFVTGCKGAVLCTLFALLFIGCIFAWRRRKNRILISSCCTCFVLLIIMFAIPDTNSRIHSFVAEVEQNHESQEKSEAEEAEKIDSVGSDMTNSGETENSEQEDIKALPEKPIISFINIFNCLEWSQDVYEKGQELVFRHPELGEDLSYDAVISQYVIYTELCNEDFANGEISEQQYRDYFSDAEIFIRTSSGVRIYLWASAINEIIKSPIIGHGLGFYEKKYHLFPHNVILEVWCDFGVFGLIGLLFVASSFIYITLKIIKCDLSIEHNFSEYLVWILILSFLPNNMVSGSFYDYCISCNYFICVFFALNNLKISRLKKEQV